MAANEMFAKLGYEKDYDSTSEHYICYRNPEEDEIIFIGLDDETVSAHSGNTTIGLTFDEIAAVNQCIKENS